MREARISTDGIRDAFPETIFPPVIKSQKNDGVYRYVETAAVVLPEITPRPELEEEPRVSSHEEPVAMGLKNNKKRKIYVDTSSCITRNFLQYYINNAQLDKKLRKGT